MTVNRNAIIWCNRERNIQYRQHNQKTRLQSGCMELFNSRPQIETNRYNIIITNGGTYQVDSIELGFSCPNHKFRGVKCKHILAVELSSQLERKLKLQGSSPLLHVLHVCSVTLLI
jgi:hypothetical protein